jgi:flagellar hook-associated protein 2
MSTVNFMGSYSGIDKSMIDQLMAIEKRPLIQLSSKKTGIESAKNSWNDVRTRLKSLFDKIKALESSETYTSKLATAGEAVSITPSKNTPEGSYQISVQQLATTTSIIGSTQNDSTVALGATGSFTINGATQVDVGDTDTVRSLADKINLKSKDSGVSASIIDNRLVLSNIKTGDTDIALVDVSGTVVEATLGLGTTGTLSQGKNALFTVNGVQVERTSNTITDVVEYTTISLTKEHAAGQSDTINVTLDTAKTAKAVEEFVAQYNSTMEFIEGKLAAGEVGVDGSRGALAGDSSLMRLHSSLRSMVTSSITNGTTTIRDLSQIGVTTTDRFGKLKFDHAKLTEQLAADPDQVKNFFASKDALGESIGFVPRINSYVDQFVSSSGIIDGKTAAYERSLKDIKKQVEAFTLRMEKKEKYFMNMFSKLDTAMMQAESQMGWLTSQISGMTASSGK